MQIGRSREDIFVRIIGVGPESEVQLQLGIGLRHDLHQSHRTRARGYRLAMKFGSTAAFLLHDVGDPGLRNPKPDGRRRHDRLPPRNGHWQIRGLRGA